MQKQRLDKILASQNKGSRKEVGAMIRRGEVRVNGVPIKDPAEKFDAEAVQITCGGETVSYAQHVYIMLHKPAGVLSASRDPQAKTVIDLVPPALYRRGLFPAGRLDKDTTGLLILTDDGDYAHRMLSPEKHVNKIYRAKLDLPVTEEDIRLFAQGIVLKTAQYAPARLWTEDDPTVAFVCVQEGKFHQVKRMFAAAGKEVLELKRLQIGGLALDEMLQPGECRPLKDDEIQAVFRE